MSDFERLMDDDLLSVAGGVKTDIEVAYDVIDGKYGNGQDRINRLRAAGYDPQTIQSIVNYLLKQPKRYNIPGYRDPYLG